MALKDAIRKFYTDTITDYAEANLAHLPQHARQVVTKDMMDKALEGLDTKDLSALNACIQGLQNRGKHNA